MCPTTYNIIIKILSQHKKWLDVRHAFTLAWMVVGLIRSEKISPSAWIPYVESRAAQSTQRRFHRWLRNHRINVNELYGPLIQEALAEWGEHILGVFAHPPKISISDLQDRNDNDFRPLTV